MLNHTNANVTINITKTEKIIYCKTSYSPSSQFVTEAGDSCSWTDPVSGKVSRTGSSDEVCIETDFIFWGLTEWDLDLQSYKKTSTLVYGQLLQPIWLYI